MQSNLSVNTYRNGESIPQISDPVEWFKTKEGAWCYLNNDSSNNPVLGKLYNWYAVNDPRGLAPAGWHVPSDEEWTILINYLGGDLYAGKKMKATTMWGGDGQGTNSSGFTAFPGSFRDPRGYYGAVNAFANFWSASKANNDSAWYRSIWYCFSSVTRTKDRFGYGFSIRCVRD